jgi:hypothetical protein
MAAADVDLHQLTLAAMELEMGTPETTPEPAFRAAPSVLGQIAPTRSWL